MHAFSQHDGSLSTSQRSNLNDGHEHEAQREVHAPKTYVTPDEASRGAMSRCFDQHGRASELHCSKP